MSLESPRRQEKTPVKLSPLEDIAVVMIDQVEQERINMEQRLINIDTLLVPESDISPEKIIINTLFNQNNGLVSALAHINYCLGRLQTVADYKPALEQTGSGGYATIEPRLEAEKNALEAMKEQVLSRMEGILKTPVKDLIVNDAEKFDAKNSQ